MGVWQIERDPLPQLDIQQVERVGGNER